MLEDAWLLKSLVVSVLLSESRVKSANELARSANFLRAWSMIAWRFKSTTQTVSQFTKIKSIVFAAGQQCNVAPHKGTWTLTGTGTMRNYTITPGNWEMPFRHLDLSPEDSLVELTLSAVEVPEASPVVCSVLVCQRSISEIYRMVAGSRGIKYY